MLLYADVYLYILVYARKALITFGCVESVTVDMGDCLKFDQLIETTSPFLFPFVLEYSLIAMGTLAVMYSAVDEATDEQANTLRRIQNLFRVPALSANTGRPTGWTKKLAHLLYSL